MNSILKIFSEEKKCKDYLDNIKNKVSPISILGLTDVAKVCISYLAKETEKRPIVYVTYNDIQAKKLINNLKYFTEDVVYIPKKEIVTYDYLAESKDLLYERIESFNQIKIGKAKAIVTTIESIMQPVISEKILYNEILEFKIGKEFDLDELKEKIISLGYERTDLIEGRGQFSVRGGIVDIALSNAKGVRIEFWGDEIDSIRIFNISSQRSIENIEKINIYPAHEYILEKSLQEVCENILDKNEETEAVKQDVEKIKNGDYIGKVDKYFTSFYSERANILDYLNNKYIIYLDEEAKIRARSLNITNDNNLVIKSLLEKEKHVPDIINLMYNYEEIESNLEHKQIVYLEKNDIISNRENTFNFTFREVNYTKNSMETLFNDIVSGIDEEKKIIILAGNKDTVKKISQLFLENDIPYKFEENISKEIKYEKPVVTEGLLETGFEFYDGKLIVISGEELFNKETKKRRKQNSVFNQGEKVVFADLKIGDYVVHRTHGIGIFAGVNTIKADGVTKDYIKIKYKDDDILYIPTNSLDNIRKYVGGGESSLKLNRLGSKEWEKTKNKVKSNLREVARNLIELYAKRQKAKGYSFSPDTPWQQEFEGSFPYIETDDQLRCIEEVKKDMELVKPMDRLLCGDVGYGKTEVALRAAFKACMDQKQVAYLAPTTILAEQQYQTFKERMENFPIRIALLNRFKTKKEQEKIIKDLKLGELDIVIGTHRILSKDVEFKDLGLLIIDEEHRFGVKDKEKIKEIKNSVDVLTMTATPIPRTLHMSIVGVRDMSVIYEPPQNRKPVQTYVLEYDEEVIREAITKELERKGQVFYLYNKVETIAKKADEIQRLVPEAKIGYAHGKMTGAELEEIMFDFINGNINVLVCTTILESGIDIPNANTIIVENADRLGLAQLYQIRGRVGRSNTQSYAYITYKRDKLLSEVADKRLKAIKEFTEFGSGFKIAMRDLEIRGAGSLLGEIQHGHIDQVGYDTYCKLLDEVVKEIQGEEVVEEPEIQIDINVSSYIPDEYIESSSQKIEVYQDIALCKTKEDIQDILDELIDRFGEVPEDVLNLLDVAEIKQMCKEANVLKINQKGNRVLFYFDALKFNFEMVDYLIKNYRNRIQFSASASPYITYKLTNEKSQTVLKEIKEFLKDASNNK